MKPKMKDREGLMLLSLTLAVIAKDGTDEDVEQAAEAFALHNETAATETA